MVGEKFSIEEFVPKEASEEAFEAFVALENLYLSETDPDDPPHTIEYRRSRLYNIPETVVRPYFWVVRANAGVEMVGYCSSFNPLQDNLHLSPFTIYVHPEWRQQGIGKALLKVFVEMAEKEQRRTLITFEYENIEAGAVFGKRMGAEKGLASTENQAKVAEVDRELMRKWIEGGKERTDGFEVGFWEGLPPEKELTSVAELLEVMNTAPWDDLDIEEFQFTPERIREEHANDVNSGTVHLWAYARETETGELAGFTDAAWNPGQGYMLSQYNTGVLPKFRRKGLGRWLKAEMFEKIVVRFPEVKFIRTANAASNAPMLKINYEMGFELYKTSVVLQVEIKKVKAYLGE